MESELPPQWGLASLDPRHPSKNNNAKLGAYGADSARRQSALRSELLPGQQIDDRLHQAAIQRVLLLPAPHVS